MLKSCTLNIYLLHRAWSSEPRVPEDFLPCTRELIEKIFTKVQNYVQCAHEDQKIGHLQELYKIFAELTMVTDLLRSAELPPPLITRPIHDLRESIHAFEKLRVFSDYRTPSSIRAFTKMTILTSPIILGPYFASLGDDFPGWWTPYASCFILALFLHVLQNVQRMLENPFVSHGTIDQDDIKLDSMQAMQAILQPERTIEREKEKALGWTSEMAGQDNVASAYFMRLEVVILSAETRTLPCHLCFYAVLREYVKLLVELYRIPVFKHRTPSLSGHAFVSAEVRKRPKGLTKGKEREETCRYIVRGRSAFEGELIH